MGTSLGIQLHSEPWPLLMGNQVPTSQAWEKPWLDCSRKDAPRKLVVAQAERRLRPWREVCFVCHFFVLTLASVVFPRFQFTVNSKPRYPFIGGAESYP